LKVGIVCLFPKYFESPIKYAPLRKAIELGKLEIRFFSPIDYAEGPKDVEDYLYGGGEGMLLRVDFMVSAIRDAKEWLKSAPVFLLSPTGKRLEQKDIIEISKLEEIILVGGHYKGIDSRIYDYVDVEISIGDFVVSSGEIASLVVLDAVARLIEGVLTHKSSAETDSLYHKLLEPPLYTRPYDFEGKQVPKVLLSGNHNLIALWRKEQAIKRTLLFRPDLLEKANFDENDRKILKKIVKEICEKFGDL
jgi:tRNA (guanine37-N1)-methyltransferase